jgi:hypothetical protein
MSERIERPTRKRLGRPPGAITKHGKKRPRGIGAHAYAYTISSIDRRTKQGRLITKVRAELLEHVGPHPSPVQRMLIQRACVLSLRLAQIDKKIYEEREFTLVDNNYTVAWQNALTRTLVALGVHQEAARNGVASLEAVLAEMNHHDAV